jgi:hypothetical protein
MPLKESVIANHALRLSQTRADDGSAGCFPARVRIRRPRAVGLLHRTQQALQAPFMVLQLGILQVRVARHDLRVTEDVNAKQVQVKPEARLAMSPTMSRGIDYDPEVLACC